MYLLTEKARLACKHLGVVGISPKQPWVRIEGRRVLIEPDTERRPIRNCPNVGGAMKPCNNTIDVRGGYSRFLRIGGKRICLETIHGFTDGTPPGLVEYQVLRAGQHWIGASA
jgi:hypothetical protein